MLDVSPTQTDPRIIQVTFVGVSSREEVANDGRFATVIKRFQGAPFRVVCDFQHASAMSPAVADMFALAQSFAIRHGMERDAFVSQSKILRLQLARVASESSRLRRLGPLRFFDTLEQAYVYILQPAVAPQARKLG